MMKPYRLINASELKKLSTQLTEIVEQWSAEYCQDYLSVQLVAAPKNTILTEAVAITADLQSVAFLEKNYLSTVKLIVFGENDPCFDPSSQELFSLLINKLLQTDHHSIETSSYSTPDWFYSGSTSLKLILSARTSVLTIILSPEWVYKQLPQNRHEKATLNSLDSALAQHSITLNLDLIPIHLPLNHLINLQVGDVISTDHPMTSPLRLTQEGQLFSEAELGQSASYKSIVLTRST